MTKIDTTQLYDGTWHASDDRYDGAPDAGKQVEGFGNTKQEAINNFQNMSKLVKLYEVLMQWEKRDLVETFIQTISANDVNYYLNEAGVL